CIDPARRPEARGPRRIRKQRSHRDAGSADHSALGTGCGTRRSDVGPGPFNSSTKAPRPTPAARRRPPVLVIVGGMLGAGKPTLILAAARRLSSRRLRCAVVTNDQGHGLVDTAMAREASLPVE